MCNCAMKLQTYTCAGPQPGFMKAEEILPLFVLIGVESGSFDFGIGQQTGRASFGDLVLAPPGAVFRRKSHGEIAFHVFYFSPPPETSLLDKLPVGKVSVADVSRLSSTYASLRKAWREFGASIRQLDLTGHLLMDLLYMCELERQYVSTRTKKVTDPLMQRAAGRIHRQLFGRLNMQGIAAELGIKPSELTRRFRLAYGVAPVEYATRLRLDEVKRLLRETNETLDAIACRCGYESGTYLSRVFRSKLGVTPSAFRHYNQF
ncbi:helix-turn-helix transcriptional regulator [Paenibacillus mesophilus]|uniref:helix-turn-helix domain-containing protein n=1 Tax=Paenibacillus mesophilus TaxID=2582849 RepID=UPI00110F3466|nr:AraC family transcriptional regulator [Paenibacillus mesophilus]TMV48287.1 helix-turn-helix transcriptional regulator [Paenibacillus mesophilus]